MVGICAYFSGRTTYYLCWLATRVARGDHPSGSGPRADAPVFAGKGRTFPFRGSRDAPATGPGGRERAFRPCRRFAVRSLLRPRRPRASSGAAAVKVGRRHVGGDTGALWPANRGNDVPCPAVPCAPLCAPVCVPLSASRSISRGRAGGGEQSPGPQGTAARRHHHADTDIVEVCGWTRWEAAGGLPAAVERWRWWWGDSSHSMAVAIRSGLG